jgi:hypothetical protein
VLLGDTLPLELANLLKEKEEGREGQKKIISSGN